MSEKIKIAIDAMGGDGSPKKVIDGIIYNHQSNKNNFYKIFGDKNKISQLATSRINVVHFIFLLSLIFGRYLLFSDNLFILSQTLFSFAHKITLSFFAIMLANAVPHAPPPITPIVYIVLSFNSSFTFHE